VTALPNNNWFVARTQAHRERWAAENVSRLGFSYYFPIVLETRRVIIDGRRMKEFRPAPLFPGYLFVQHEAGQWHVLLSTFGVIGVVLGSGGQPGIIRNAEIQRLRSLEQNGTIVLPKKQNPQNLRDPNVRARITSGPYTGFVGLTQGIAVNERINILLDFMGGKVKFLVREGDLELA